MTRPVKSYRLAVVGSRSFHDYWLMEYEIDRIIKREHKPGTIFTIVSGGARGADTLAKRYAECHPVAYKEFKPDWETHGKKARILRNIVVVEYSNAVLSFWNGKSKGTKHTMGYAQYKKKRLKVVRF